MGSQKQVRKTGEYVTCSVTGESYQAFVPVPLPPDPPLNTNKLARLLAAASTALGRLDGLAGFLPDISLFIYMFIRKEALLSSQIEGTQSSFSDLLLFENDEAPGVPVEDVQEVSNYVAAIGHGLDRLRAGFPLSLRLLREIHEILLRKGRGREKMPGEFRRSQNWIGGPRPSLAKFVPPPVDRLDKCLGELEAFLHAEDDMAVLIKAALAHVQFETIHPFLDGNGRLGRLLIALLLCEKGVLKEPIMYLSLYFKEHRQEYYDQLQYVRETGDWEEWVSFFLKGVALTSEQGVKTAQNVMALFETDTMRIEKQHKASTVSVLKTLRALQKKPICGAGEIAKTSDLTIPTVNTALTTLETMGIVAEITGRKRDRIYAYKDYVALLGEGTDPL